MVLAYEDAMHFIQNYKRFLLEVGRLSDSDAAGPTLVEQMSAARTALHKNPDLFDRAIASLETSGQEIAEDVMTALQTLQLRNWVYLRDTTRYSIFLDGETEHQEAYAVLGLTNRIRDIVGGTGILLHTGVFAYRGHYVCDGILAGSVWLGPNYRRDYSDLFSEIKQHGRFHKTPQYAR